jgi:hypothetical protein
MGIKESEDVVLRDFQGRAIGMEKRNKNLQELELETAQAKQQSEDIQSFKYAELGRNLGRPFSMMGSAASKAVDTVDRVGRSPMSQAMGQRRSSVTPMGIQGGDRLFRAPPTRPTGLGMGPSLHTGAGLGNLRTGMSIPRSGGGGGISPLPIAPRPTSFRSNIPSVMPSMNFNQAPRINLNAGMGLRRPSAPRLQIRAPQRQQTNNMRIPKIRLF